MKNLRNKKNTTVFGLAADIYPQFHKKQPEISRSPFHDWTLTCTFDSSPIGSPPYPGLKFHTFSQIN